MSLFKKKAVSNVSAELLPTYYAPFAKDIKRLSEGFSFQLTAQDGTDVFEIWYYGNLMGKTFIVSTDEGMSKVVAKAVSTGQEILLFDGVTHGYDNMVWQEHPDADKVNRNVKKSDFGNGRIFIKTESLPDDESDWELDENGCVTSEHNKKFKWTDFKRDAITWLTIDLVTENGKKKEILDEELA